MAAQDLCTLPDVRAALEVPTADTKRDTLISSYITRASDALMNEVDREFAPATGSATRRFEITGFYLSLSPYDLRTVSSFVLNPEGTSPQTLVAGTDYELRPIGSPSGTFGSDRFSGLLILASQTVFTFDHALCDITGAWGFASVPEDVKQAAILTVAAWLRADKAALEQAAEVTGEGQILAPSFAASYSISGDAKSLLEPWYRLRAQVAVLALSRQPKPHLYRRSNPTR